MSSQLPSIVKAVLDTTIQLTGAERAFLMLRDVQGEFDIVGARNRKLESLKSGEYEISRTVVNRVVQQGEAVLTTNANEDPRFDGSQKIVECSFPSILCVPLKVKEKLIGVIYVDSRVHERIFSERDQALFSAFANQAAVALENARLFNDLSIFYDQILEALVAALEVRDHETEGHTKRVKLYSLALARILGLSEEEQLNLHRGALMHDIGKLGVPDSILLKPEPLTEEEWVVMKRHPESGVRMLEGISFFKGAIEIIWTHHERWDGNGYPSGLKGEEIPLGARILAVANTFDVMTSDQPYRSMRAADEAYKEILNNAGSQFDPVVVEAFCQCWERGEMEAIWKGGHGP